MTLRAEVAQAERFDHGVGPRNKPRCNAGLFTSDPCWFGKVNGDDGIPTVF